MKAGIKVFAPASVANVGCGFDVLGFALQRPGDEIIARPSSSAGLKIVKITGDDKLLPYEIEKNTAGVAAQRLLQHLGRTNERIELEIHKKMPFSSGLGSSAASAAGAVVAVNELLGRPLAKADLLPFAVLGEQVADGAFHADNVAPSLLGGLILIRDNKTLDFHRIPVPGGLKVVVIHPKIKIKTKDARDMIRPTVSLSKMVEQTGNLGSLLLGFLQSNIELIGRSLQDVVIEPQRAKLIPGFYQVKDTAMNNGALGCSISGAGPSVFALFQNSIHAERAATEMQEVFRQHQIPSTIYLSNINQGGTELL